MSEAAKLRIDPELRFEAGQHGEPRSLREYQQQASTALHAEPEAPPWTREAALLSLEGYSYRVRCGKRIWCRDEGDPWSGWVSEEEAYRRVTEGEES